MDESLKDSLRLISAPSRPLSRRIASGLDARKQRCRVFMMFFFSGLGAQEFTKQVGYLQIDGNIIVIYNKYGKKMENNS